MADLRQRLDRIAWHEQVERELADRPAVAVPPDLAAIDAELQALAVGLDSTLLDALEREDGYLVWALRLAPFVESVDAPRRAGPHIDSQEWRVRYWARRVAGIAEA
jgi:hypothetical protein